MCLGVTAPPVGLNYSKTQHSGGDSTGAPTGSLSVSRSRVGVQVLGSGSRWRSGRVKE